MRRFEWTHNHMCFVQLKNNLKCQLNQVHIIIPNKIDIEFTFHNNKNNNKHTEQFSGKT